MQILSEEICAKKTPENDKWKLSKTWGIYLIGKYICTLQNSFVRIGKCFQIRQQVPNLYS